MGLYGALYGRAGEYPGYSFWSRARRQPAGFRGRDGCQRGAHAITTADAGVLGKGFVVSQSTSSIRPMAPLSDSQFINAMYLNTAAAGDPNGISIG